MLLPVPSDDRMLLSFTILKRKITQNKTFPLLHYKMSAIRTVQPKARKPISQASAICSQHLTMLPT